MTTSIDYPKIQYPEISPYALISIYYSGKVAKRSKIPYMKHIDDGIKILGHGLGVKNKDLFDAWCLHPIYQSMSPDEIAHFYTENGVTESIISQTAIEMAKQYAEIANSFLTHHADSGNFDIFNIHFYCQNMRRLLIADKVSNYIDFAIASGENVFDNEPAGYIDNRMEYFNAWLTRLGVDQPLLDTLREQVSRDYPWQK